MINITMNGMDIKLPSGKSKSEYYNIFNVQVIRGGEVIHEENYRNGVTNEGHNHALDCTFNVAAQQSWYIGLAAGTGVFSATDTMASHAGWTENTSYSEGTRPAWGQGAASGQAVTNGTAVDFSITASDTLKGLFLTSNNTKGGTTGILYATAPLSPELSVTNGDTVRVTYTVSLA